MVLPNVRKWGKKEVIEQRVQTFSYKINKLWRSNTPYSDFS